MATILISSLAPLAGKTTIVAGLVAKLRAQGLSVQGSRQGDDANAAADARLFASLAPEADAADVTLIEAPAADTATPTAGASVLAVVDAVASAEDVASRLTAFGDASVGVILNCTPRKRIDVLRSSFEAAGVNVLAVVPEDRVLAAPLLRDVAAVLQAQVSFLSNGRSILVEQPVIATISADPGQGYFSRYGATVVVVRSDKPDLQLAALNAEAACLIVTGELPLLSYVLDRAEEDEIPLVRTKLSTIETIQVIEALFATGPFAGGEEKLNRIAELLGELDMSRLLPGQG